jgi:transcriptional regulator with GAF, ATPase, and Fis domain
MSLKLGYTCRISFKNPFKEGHMVKKSGGTKVIRWGEQPTTLLLPKCKLAVLDGADKGKELTVDRATIKIGTKKDCEMMLTDDTVSRIHAEITKNKQGYLLRDLDSTNGTFVEGLKVKEAYLAAGSVIRVGETKIKFVPQDEKIEIVPSTKSRFGEIIGQSLEMRKIYGILEKVAPTNVTVIITGETGTGKELVAKGLHSHSKRSKRPFVVFDCSAVQKNLIESELFGHERGSFTGATATRQGAFELADGGTIFLDEIGELSMDMQPKLLRALEQGEVKRVGADRPRRVDVRVIAATNRDLKDEVKKGNFREDLFFRISVVQVHLPPLRKRMDDMPMLIEHFIDVNSTQEEERKQGTIKFSEASMDVMREHSWPGNIRELKNVIDRSISFSETEIINVAELPEYLREKSVVTSQPRIRGDMPFKEAKEKWVESFEKDYLIDLLKKNNLNISKAAKQAGIDRKSVQRLLKKYNLNVKDL